MMFARSLAAAIVIALSAGAAGQVQAAANPRDVAEAEQAFAADGKSMGMTKAFLKHMADDAILFAPDPVNAKERFSARDASKDPKLVWWPTVAAISRSADLGFTMGPYEIDGKRGGHYFTVWKKQADGTWKWVYDGGVENDASGAPDGAKIRYFKTNSIPTVSGSQYRPERGATFAADGALSAVEGAELDLAAMAKEDIVEAYDDYLATDAIVMGSPAAPATTEAAIEAELKTRSRRTTFAKLGGGMSAAGDFAWTYGDANWSKSGEKHRAHYVRVWQKQHSGWRIIFDELIEVR
jgi:ketosteroid isomerase-like protein